jgi:dephospho-CoA kinase
LTIDVLPAYSRAMLLAGLTGGLATGKSTVAKLFQDCGAIVLDADVLARDVVEPGKPAWRDLVRTFGRGVLRSDQTLDRARLASIVFRDPGKLRKLNRIVHPRVAREQARLTREVRRKDPHAVVVYDAPLLIEAGAHTRMDRVVIVTTDRATQVARLKARNRLSRSEALRRIGSQMPLQQKLKLADYVIDGTMPLDELRRLVEAIYRELQRSA